MRVRWRHVQGSMSPDGGIMEDDEFEWDDEKAKTNVTRHDVSFELARRVFDDLDRQERLDDDPEEERWVVMGLVDVHVLVVAYTERNGRIRIISARKATRNEQRRYYARL